MKTADLDAVIASVPIDKTAARQMSKGIHWEPKLEIAQTHVHQDAPTLRRVPSHIVDLTGRTFGRLTVVGLFHEKGSFGQRKKLGEIWQVRCQCGQYETRRGKGIQFRTNHDDCCIKCSYAKGLANKGTRAKRKHVKNVARIRQKYGAEARITK